MTKTFDNRVALVTGAGSGLGEAIAKQLAAEGAPVVLADMDLEGLERVKGEIDGAGGSAEVFQADVSDANAVEAMIDFAQSTFGPLQLAVNNAGIGGPMADTGSYPLDGWRNVMNVNLDGVFYCRDGVDKTISRQWLIEFEGAKVGEVNKGFASLVAEAGLGPEVTPHTLRHTAATWLMQSGADLWDTAGFLGMSVATLERVYGHHHPDHQRTAVENLGRRGR